MTDVIRRALTLLHWGGGEGLFVGVTWVVSLATKAKFLPGRVIDLQVDHLELVAVPASALT